LVTVDVVVPNVAVVTEELVTVEEVEFVVRLVVEEPVSFTALLELLVCVELVDLVEFVPFTCGR